MAEVTPPPFKVFYSYAHKDEKLCNELKKHLYPLKRQELIVDWFDRDIVAGTEWEQEITHHLETAHIILLLISPDFMASDYCYGIEMKRALERHDVGSARVVPVLLEAVYWQDAPFGKLQMLPKGAKAVRKWSNKNEAFTNVATSLRRTIEDLQKALPAVPVPAPVAPEAVNTPPALDLPLPDSITSPVLEAAPVLQPVWSVPQRRNPYFTGRVEILQRLRETFTANDLALSHQPLVLSGLGGMGKTQIAIEYAHRYREEYQTVLWAKADSLEVLSTELASFALPLHLPGGRSEDQKYAVDAVKNWLEISTDWLLILDNVEDLPAVSNFLPAAPRGHILLTSQLQVTSGLAFRLGVEQMTPEEGCRLLLQRANLLTRDGSLEAIPTTERAVAAEIVEELGCLPLALAQAGAYIDETGCGLAGYLKLYQERRGDLLKFRGGFTSEHPASVATTLALSFANIEQTDRAAVELLRFFAFLHPDAIFEALVLKGSSQLGSLLQSITTDNFTLNQSLAVLYKYSLVRRNPEGTLTVHRLVQTVLKENLSQEERRQWSERSILAVNQAFPAVEFTTWQDCRRYLPHIQVCASLVEHEHIALPEAARLFREAGYYLYGQAQYPEAEPLLVQSVALAEQTSGSEHLEVARSLNHLAELYREQGQYPQAEPLYLRAIAIHEQQAEPASLDLATCLNNLGRLYNAQARYEQEEPLYLRALEIRKSILGNEHSDVATSLNNLAKLYRDEGQYTRAKPLYQQTLTIKELTLGPEHPDTAMGLNNLAAFYQDEGQYAQARPLHQRALAIREKVLGAEHPDTAMSLNNLGFLYQSEGQYAQARLLHQRALTIREKVLGAEHPDTASSLSSLAGLYQTEGQYVLARPLYQRALTIREKVLGAEHPDTAISLNSLAGFYQAEGQYVLARPLYQRALAIREKVLGAEHPDTASTLANLATFYGVQQQYRQAEPLFQRAFKIYEQTFGLEHPDTIRILQAYIITLHNAKQTRKARELEKRLKTTNKAKLKTRTAGEPQPASETL